MARTLAVPAGSGGATAEQESAQGETLTAENG
jgi:hypothetical protein